MTLADLIDLEAQLARDREAEPGALELRDRALMAGEQLDPGRRGEVIARWLVRLRQREPARLFPGRAATSALRGLRAALGAAGLVLGWGAVAAVLRYQGTQPVNVWDFLLAFVGVQLLLIVLLLLSLGLPVASLGTPLMGMFRGIFGAVYPRLAAAGLADGERAAEWQTLWRRLRARRSLYHRVEPWALLRLTQVFGVAFNVGALLGLARLVVFSDVAFSWGTTLVELDAHRFHRLVGLLAAPFGWAFPEAVPSLSLVEATRYSRLDAAYLVSGTGRTARPDLVGGWWPFLAAALGFYGLLPRLLTLAISRLRLAQLLARLPLDDVEVSRLVHRLVEAHVETVSPSAEAPGVERPSATASTVGSAGSSRCAVVLWRDLPPVPGIEAVVRRHTGFEVMTVHRAGGLDFEEGGRDWAGLLGGDDPLVVLAEGWEAPDRSVLRLLGELRRAKPWRHLRVLLLGDNGPAGRPASRAQVELWRDSLSRLTDPFLAVEALENPP